MGRFIVILLLGVITLSAKADVAVLVHGYLGSAASWERSGVNAELAQQGWPLAGVFTSRGLIALPGVASKNTIYTIELPSIEPVARQADILRGMLGVVDRRHPGEPVILIGHSTGGVVARMALVQGGMPQVKALVTIASPHLGTVRAVEALDKTDDSFPISWMKEFFIGDIYSVVRDSWGVLLDLTPEQPGNLLFWLNRQPHPDIRYFSVIRPGPVGMGDELVPAFSQDMNNVSVLRGKSGVRLTPVTHTLHSMDGKLLAEILATL
ncbi:MAG: alpha/beta fold hydrolase [Candidatus Thiodiazotropha sp.]|jgi:triacylglycerol lipase